MGKYGAQITGFANINYMSTPAFVNPAVYQLMNKNIELVRRNSTMSVRSEQEVLDTGFMNLFETKKDDASSTQVAYDLKPPARPAPMLPSNGDLIDLDVDRQKSANILDLFDPLSERPVEAPMPLMANASDKADDTEVKKILESPKIRLKKRNSLNLEEEGVVRNAATRIARKGQHSQI
jgi:hypothetical protein